MSRNIKKLHQPDSKLDKYDNEKYLENPLLKFFLSQVKERKHYTLLKKKADEEKIKLCRKPITDLDDVIPIVEKVYIKKIHLYAANNPMPKMMNKTEKLIINFAPKRLRDKYPTIVGNYMKDVHNEYNDIIENYSIKNILIPITANVEDRCDKRNVHFEKFNFKYLGKTENYNNYLINREKLRKQLLITYPFIRCIINYSYLDFPNIINDFGKYRVLGDLTLDEFTAKATSDINNNATFLVKEWYPKIIKIIKKHYKRRTVPNTIWPRVFDCAINLIKRQLNELKIRSFNHIFDILLTYYKVPYLKLNTMCDKQLNLNPSLDDIFQTYYNIFELINKIGNNFILLPKEVDKNFVYKYKKEYQDSNIGDIYMVEMHKKLTETLKIAYNDIIIYLNNFQSNFINLYSVDIENDLTAFLSVEHTFNEYLEKIDYFNEFIEKLKRLVQNEYFDIATVCQYRAIQSMRVIAKERIDSITINIVKTHFNEAKTICNLFNNIKKNALKIPRSTEELLESGEYMLQVKTVEMFVLQERIQESLRIGGLLIELTELNEEHLAAQIATINLFHNMKNVFEKNASLFEMYKSQFEEHLQTVTKKLNEDIADLLPNLSVINDMCDETKLREYYIILQGYIDQLVIFDDYVQWINKEEVLFKFPKSLYPILESIKEFVIPFAALMRLCIRWARYYYVWMDGPFEYLEPHFVEQTTEEFYKEFLKIQKYYRNKIKADLIGSPVCKFRGQTEDPDPSKHPVPLKLCTKMINWIKDFRIGVQIVNIMCNPALCDRHWEEMSEISGFDLTPDAGTTLRKIINLNLNDKLDSFEIISVGANKELQLQQNLEAMMKEWENMMFNYGKYKETDITILSSLDDVQALLDDHILKTLSMRGSAFVKPCEKEVQAWYDKLMRVNKTLEEWGKVQASWLYLLPIFSSKDIVAQMPEEGRLFQQVDQTYRRYMQMVIKQPLVMETAPAPGLLEAMELSNQMLEDITNGVNAYLEKKRLYFPRFFFLSNDEMLEILSETKDPLRVQPHLNKCFEGINCLEFDFKLDIHAMISSDKERLEFVQIISTSEARGSVEIWLLRVEEEMLKCVANELALSYSSYLLEKREHWVTLWPQMIVLCISQVFWAVEVHACLQVRNRSLILSFYEQLIVDLNNIVALIRSKTISNLNRITIKSLIVIDVHAKDVVNDLIEKRVHSEDDFQWLAQLRYYWSDGFCLVKIINATVPYANEYLGNSDRLVITPLTDRCYRTLVGAYQLHLNGAPEGPAGTGKTETTKDLAKALAVQCKVFNCSDGLDYKAMGKFFKGLASSGAWACFDEFNRIELEVLSVVAQQILCIIQAIRGNVKKFIFEGTELQLNPACYVCITMNPGYAGRSELPDNLKVLFRTVAMMVPDYAMIGEISLYSFGFVNARILSVKIVTTYRLCSEQLSSQNHYDYGMRAVKTVLSACGNIKKAFPDENEDILLLRSLIDVNLPKFLSFDIPLFEGIISDLFPGISLPEPDYALMTIAFNEVCASRNLQPKNSFLTKVIQTYEMMIVRHGFMLVGEPFAGKSCTLKVLAEVLGKLKSQVKSPYYQDVQFGIINPKAISMGQLYGAFDPISYEWTDGIAATIFRVFATNTTDDRKWLIFDGPVDAVWIENMNTVLDDNKKLCLTSGEVITMSNSMSMIFEVMDLAQASPATVSRCGMIYMEPITLGWKTFAKSWLNQLNPIWSTDYRELIMDLLMWIIPPTLLFVRRNCKQLLYPGDINLVLTTLKLYEMIINDAVEENLDEYSKYIFYWLQTGLIFCVVWGIGGILDFGSREKFDVFYREMWKGTDESNPLPASVGKIDISIPGEGMFIDYIYIFKQKGAWKYWPDIVRRMEIDESSLGAQVPTIDTARYMYILDLHIKHNRSLLFVGPTGTGKSFYIQNTLMNKLDADKFIPAFITFTVMITANQTQDLVISKLNKRKRGIFGPPVGKTCVIFIDDMNMPVKEVYGAQPPIELIRQYFDYKHWYDLKDTSKIYLSNILIICACGLIGGSRQDVYARFLAHFNVFSINNFSEDTMFKIFTMTLLSGLKKNGHGSDVILNVNQIVNATLQMYKNVTSDLLPTPQKSHYIFNLRDVARVVGGCALLKKESVENKRIFPKIWTHESLRVFADRLIDDNDRKWFFRKIADTLRDNFKDRIENIFEEYLNPDGTVTTESFKNLMFGTYLDMDAEAGDRRYDEISNINIFRDIALANIEEYNQTHKSKMDIVLFEFALQHLNKICRIMAMPAGSSLLVGMGGSGRQSSTRLAATISQQTLFQPEITKNYGMNDWRDDLKKVLKESGGAGKDTVFLFTEGQIKMEAFLQDIDCLLNLGEVPNIFAIDEKQEIMEMVRLAAQGGNRNIDISPLQVFSFFINRCKRKLHIILCFSPIGSSFRTRVRLYPSLVNCCTIDWFESWPEDALEMIAEKYMQVLDVPENIKKSIVLACQHFHVTARQASSDFFTDTGRITYVTSASYLELIKSFRKLTNLKQNEIRDAKMRYVGGLETLQKASDAVAIMQRDLNALQPKLLIMAENSRQMTEQIEKKTIEASVATEQVKKDEIVANEQAAAAQVLKAECEKDLAQAIPILEEAIGALNTLKPADITLVKSMKNPPEIVKLVMAGVCVIKGINPDRINDPTTGKKILDYWGPSKRLLGDMNFLQSLKDFDKDNINPEIMKRIRKDFIPHKDFQPRIVAKASSAAEGLCKWIIAMDLYDAVAKVVAPKKARLEQAEREYSNTMKYLEEKRAMAEELEKKVAKLNEELAEANAQRASLEAEVENCKNKLIRAETLLGGLGGERSRWTTAAENLQKLFDSLAGDILISCGVIAYLAPLNLHYRYQCVTNWHAMCNELKIPCSVVFSFVDVLGSEIKIQSWNLAGLPRDNFSAENGIIMDSSNRYSLFIDPQTQANKWIKEMERKNRLMVVKFSQSDYMKKIEVCLEYGNPVLVENVQEDIEAPLDPILSKNTFRQGGVDYISLGDNIVAMSPKFRMYLTSTLRNPHYLPEVFNKVTIINFALTVQGLEDQLLGIVVAKERPDLQELRQSLIVESAQNKAMLKQVEDSILQTLSQCKGDILEDETAIRILDESKILSVNIIAKQAASKETEIQIESFRQNYKPVAAHSSILYYCITDLPNIDPMYQFSLAWYINLYIYSIENANKSKELLRRVKFLMDAVTQNLYNNVCRSLFEKDKLLFSFILATKIMLANNQIEMSAFMFLLTGGVETGSVIPNPEPQWITEKIWEDICSLEEIKSLKGFASSFKKNIVQWKTYYDHMEPHLQKMPEPWEKSTHNFEKLIILHAIRPDKIAAAITEFVSNEMGVSYVSPPPFDISKSFEDANCLMPLIFILSPGADPMGSLLLFAEKTGFDETFQSISLGQGQGPIASNIIENAQSMGTWVCLQNCHLAASWMPTLEFIWEKMDIYNTTPSFRLWLTSYPSDKFPSVMLQNGVKMTNEPPTGLQQNLLRSYNSEPMNDEVFYTGCPGKDRAFTKLLYGVCFFHAVVQERRKFGPLGWNIPYGFNESDFQISVQQLQMFLNQYEDIPYVAISYLTGECNYGGRVTDVWDRRAIVTILGDYINADVVNDPAYKFSDISDVYKVPRKFEHRDIVKYVEDNIPTIPTPDVYGLHPNAGITRDLYTSNLLLDSMILTLGKVNTGSSEDTEAILLSTINDIVNRLPFNFDIETAKEKYPVVYNESMNTVLVQEMERFNKLLSEIRLTCIDLEKAIKGVVVMTPELEEISNSMLFKKIPNRWMGKSYPSLKPIGSYIQDFIDRLNWLQNWYDEGKPPTFWISGFYFTQAFLTGAMQNYARKYKIPIDTLTFDFAVLKEMQRKTPVENGVLVYGLFIEGARWNNNLGIVEEQKPKILLDIVPLIHFQPLLATKLVEGTRYKCPLYKTAERKGILSTSGHSTNYVLPILLNTKKEATHWVKRSVALICQSND